MAQDDEDAQPEIKSAATVEGRDSSRAACLVWPFHGLLLAHSHTACPHVFRLLQGDVRGAGAAVRGRDPAPPAPQGPRHGAPPLHCFHCSHWRSFRLYICCRATPDAARRLLVEQKGHPASGVHAGSLLRWCTCEVAGVRQQP